MRKNKFIYSMIFLSIALTSCSGLPNFGNNSNSSIPDIPDNPNLPDEYYDDLDIPIKYDQLGFMGLIADQAAILCKKDPVNYKLHYSELTKTLKDFNEDKSFYKVENNNIFTTAYFGTNVVNVKQTQEYEEFPYIDGKIDTKFRHAFNLSSTLIRGQKDNLQFSLLDKEKVEVDKDGSNNYSDQIKYISSEDNEIITNNLDFKLNLLTCSSLVGLANYDYVKQHTNKLENFYFTVTEENFKYNKEFKAEGIKEYKENNTSFKETTCFDLFIKDNYLRNYHYKHQILDTSNTNVAEIFRREISIYTDIVDIDETVDFNQYSEYKETPNLEETNLLAINLFYKRDGIKN